MNSRECQDCKEKPAAWNCQAGWQCERCNNKRVAAEAEERKQSLLKASAVLEWIDESIHFPITAQERKDKAVARSFREVLNTLSSLQSSLMELASDVGLLHEEYSKELEDPNKVVAYRRCECGKLATEEFNEDYYCEICI